MSFAITVSRPMRVPASVLYRAWAGGFAQWIAEAGTVRGTVAVGEPFCFDVVIRNAAGAESGRHPHHGRYLALEPDRRVQLTWFTAGTGVETTVTVTLTPLPDDQRERTQLTLTHDGFATAAARDAHDAAWPTVLESLETRLRAADGDDRPAGAPAGLGILPAATFIPVRSYPDLAVARRFLVHVLGASEGAPVHGGRVAFTLGTGAMMAAEWRAEAQPAGGRPPATLMVRVPDVDAAWARALAMGATPVTAPADQPERERQAVLKDPAGHSWTLTQALGDRRAMPSSPTLR